MLRASLLRYGGFPTAFASRPSSSIVTHEVENQVPFLEHYNTYDSMPRLKECVTRYGATAYTPRLEQLGKDSGSPYWQRQAHLANVYEPVFTPFDKQGRRIDQVTFVEPYHRLMKLFLQTGIAAVPSTDAAHGHVASTALFAVLNTLEQGTGCPITMTAACVPSLKSGGPFFQPYIEKMTAADYDERDLHISLKTAATCGMSMTEKQGGSDVRQNSTYAIPLETSTASQSGAAYRITGHKWFTSAPMSDSFLTLAYSGEGELSCFLIPRWVSPGERNTGLRFQRLKNKMGDKSNASSEVEYHDAVGYLVGKPGEGVRTIIKMVNQTRLTCMIGSAGSMYAALLQAIHHCTYRQAFGGALIEKPLMQNVLTDLVLEAEANMALSMRVASSFDEGSSLGSDYQRLAVAVGKYIITKRNPSFTYECMECMGGNGYLEDFPLTRYFRQSPLNAIWEGSGNVIVMDVFRALSRNSKTLHAVVADIQACGLPALDKELQDLLHTIQTASPAVAECEGRILVERLGILLQASALHHSQGEPAVVERFIASRIGQAHGKRPVQFGTLPHTLVDKTLIERNTPKLNTP